MIGADELDQILYVLLSQLNIAFNKQVIATNVIYEVAKFGTKIVYMDGQHFDKKILDGWNVAYIYPDFAMEESRLKIVWSLVRGGYFHYLRINYKKTFNHMMHSEGWDKALSEYRKKVYKNTPKYNYFRDSNEEGIRQSPGYMMSIDPGFYDFIME